VGLSKPVEDEGQRLGVDAAAVVDHLNAYVPWLRDDRDADGATRFGEFDRIREKIPQDLPEAIRVGVDEGDLGGYVDVEIEVLRQDRWLDGLGRSLQHFAQVGRTQVELERASDDPRHV